MAPARMFNTASPASLLLLVLLSFSPASETSDESETLMTRPEFREELRTAVDMAYNREYEASVEHMSEWREQYPDNPIWTFWPALDIWWDVVSDLEQEAYDELFFDRMELALDAADDHLDQHPDNVDAMIIQAGAYGFSARLHSNRHSWYTSIRDARRAMNVLSDIEEVFDELPDVEFGNAMYKYFSAFLQDEYPAVRVISWVLPSGDREAGLELLDYVAREGVILSPEARYFLGHIYLHYEKSMQDALPYLESMADDYPQNSLYTRLLIRAHYLNHNNRTAEQLTLEALDTEFKDSPHILKAAREELHYMLGRIHMRNGNYPQAAEELARAGEIGDSLTDQTERRFQVEAGFYLGQTYLNLNEPGKARRQFEKIANAETDSDLKSRAQSRLESMN